MVKVGYLTFHKHLQTHILIVKAGFCLIIHIVMTISLQFDKLTSD
jgi:hypothetical protein